MSVDPIIQSPANSQSLNPYSYLMNNPLSGTDPTGYAGVEKEVKIEAPKPKLGSKIRGKRATIKTTTTTNGNTVTVTAEGGNGSQRQAAIAHIKKGLTSESGGGNTTQGSLGSRDTQVESSISANLQTANKVVTGTGVLAGGLEATKDVNLAMKSGAGTAFAATGNSSNAFTLTKNAKSKSILASLDVSKAGKSLASKATFAGIALSFGQNIMDAQNDLISPSEAGGKIVLDLSVMRIAMGAGIPGVIGAAAYAIVDMKYEGGIIQMKRDAFRNISNAFGINKSMKAIRRREDRPRPMRRAKEFFGIPDMGY